VWFKLDLTDVLRFKPIQKKMGYISKRVVKRSGRDEPMWVAIQKYQCVQATTGISLYNYLYLKLAKTLCLFIISLTKLENKRARTGSA
jgi:hypothetical protein